MKRRQRREVRLIVELEWDPDVEDGAWPIEGPDHSVVLEHVVHLLNQGIESEPVHTKDDPGCFEVLSSSEAKASWNEWGVVVETDEQGQDRRAAMTIYGAEVAPYPSDEERAPPAGEINHAP